MAFGLELPPPDPKITPGESSRSSSAIPELHLVSAVGMGVVAPSISLLDQLRSIGFQATFQVAETVFSDSLFLGLLDKSNRTRFYSSVFVAINRHTPLRREAQAGRRVFGLCLFSFS